MNDYAYDLCLRALANDLIRRSSGSHYFRWFQDYAPPETAFRRWNSDLIEETP